MTRTIWTAGLMTPLMVVLSASLGCGRPYRALVHGIQNGRSFRVPSSRAAKVERLSLELLGNSGYENDPSIANAGVWNTFSEGDHIYLRFKATHCTKVMGETVAFTEMLLPMSVDRGPPYILVRKDGDIRAFCKYDCATATTLQDEIRAWAR